MRAASDYLNRECKNLSHIGTARDGDPSGEQPSDSPCAGDEKLAWLRANRVYVPESYELEMAPTWWQVRRARRIRTFARIAAISFAAGFLALSLWAAAHELGHEREAAAQIRGFEGK